MNLKLPPVVVLTGNQRSPGKYRSINEIALTLTRSLGRRGVPVYRFHPDRRSIDVESRYCRFVACPNLYDEAPALVDFLRAFARSQEGRPVLFPAVDGAADFIARYEGPLGERFSLVCASCECIGQIQNKQRLLERASRAGIPIPVTHFPKGPDDIERIAGSLDYPVVVKPLTSDHWRRAEVVAAIGQVKAVVVKGPGELAELYGKVGPLAPAMMVQEIVPGEIERLVTFLGCFGRDGTPLAGCVRRKMRQYPHGFGYCCLTETVHDPEIMELSLRLLKVLQYRGIGGVEFKRDPRDGLPKLIEINARPVRTTGTAIAAGVDLPWIAYQDAVSPEPPAPRFDYTVPARWVHLRGELRAAWSLMRAGELGFWQWLRIFRGRFVEAVWAWDDLRPSALNVAMPAVERLRDLVRPVLGRLRRPLRLRGPQRQEDVT